MKFNKLILNNLALTLFLTNISFDSIASNRILNENNTKEFKTYQQIADNDDIWIEGFANMPTGRSGLSSVLLDGKIYCMGGYKGSSSHINVFEVYDTLTNTWETKSPMPTMRSGFSSVVVNGKIYCIGGFNSSSAYLNTVDVYDPITDTWSTETSMPTPRSSFATEVIGDMIYCIGGQNGSYLDIVEVYNTKTKSWSSLKTNMPTARSYLSSAVVGNKIYCIGGYNKTDFHLNKLEVYDVNTNTWETKTNMPTARHGLQSSVINNKIYCIGGNNDTYLDKMEIYNLETDMWSVSQSNMPTAKANFSSVVIDDKIYCIGGRNGDNYLDKIEVYIVKPELKSSTANLDVYIQFENRLSLSIDTNSIKFNDYSGAEDMEKPNAVNLTITSTLPYQLNAYMPTEIQNSDKSEIMDKTILNIKENSELNYQNFSNINEKIVLKDNCIDGENIKHGVDLKLKGGVTYKTDSYKTTITLEVQQK